MKKTLSALIGFLLISTSFANTNPVFKCYDRGNTDNSFIATFYSDENGQIKFATLVHGTSEHDLFMGQYPCREVPHQTNGADMAQIIISCYYKTKILFGDYKVSLTDASFAGIQYAVIENRAEPDIGLPARLPCSRL